MFNTLKRFADLGLDFVSGVPGSGKAIVKGAKVAKDDRNKIAEDLWEHRPRK